MPLNELNRSALKSRIALYNPIIPSWIISSRSPPIKKYERAFTLTKDWYFVIRKSSASVFPSWMIVIISASDNPVKSDMPPSTYVFSTKWITPVHQTIGHNPSIPYGKILRQPFISFPVAIFQIFLQLHHLKVSSKMVVAPVFPSPSQL